MSKSRFAVACFTLAVSAHLIAEAHRRFGSYSQLPYVIADATLFACAGFFVVGYRSQLPSTLWILILTYLVLGAALLLPSGGAPTLLLVGSRPLVLAIAGYLVARGFFGGIDKPFDKLLRAAGCWIVIVLAVAIVQVVSGREAPINRLPALSGVDGGGIGDFTVNGVVVGDLFRPTSLFMHTGRFGQFAFVAGTIAAFAAILRPPRVAASLLAVAGLACVLVSGQRAAIVLGVTGTIAAAVLARRASVALRLVIGVVVVGTAAMFIDGHLRDAVLLRAMSGFAAIRDRLGSNSEGTLEALEEFGLVGKGIGYFSFGALPFGGEIFYDYMALRGAPQLENGWLRVLGETGLLGLAVFGATYLYLIAGALRSGLRGTGDSQVVGLLASWIGLSAGLWAITHDVFGNYLFMLWWFVLAGAANGARSRRASATSTCLPAETGTTPNACVPCPGQEGAPLTRPMMELPT